MALRKIACDWSPPAEGCPMAVPHSPALNKKTYLWHDSCCPSLAKSFPANSFRVSEDTPSLSSLCWWSGSLLAAAVKTRTGMITMMKTVVAILMVTVFDSNHELHIYVLHVKIVALGVRPSWLLILLRNNSRLNSIDIRDSEAMVRQSWGSSSSNSSSSSNGSSSSSGISSSSSSSRASSSSSSSSCSNGSSSHSSSSGSSSSSSSIGK